jgi:hypothetical protein
VPFAALSFVLMLDPVAERAGSHLVTAIIAAPVAALVGGIGGTIVGVRDKATPFMK